jgi:hypothetical protein
MSFQLRDETAGIDIMFVNNSNQMGLGSLPVNSQALTVNGNGFLNQFGNLGQNILNPGGQLGYEGSVLSGGSTVTVTISTTQLPTVSATAPASGITVTQITFLTQSGVGQQVNYSIW